MEENNKEELSEYCKLSENTNTPTYTSETETNSDLEIRKLQSQEYIERQRQLAERDKAFWNSMNEWDRQRTEREKEWDRQRTERNKAFWDSVAKMFQFDFTIDLTNKRNPYVND